MKPAAEVAQEYVTELKEQFAQAIFAARAEGEAAGVQKCIDIARVSAGTWNRLRAVADDQRGADRTDARALEAAALAKAFSDARYEQSRPIESADSLRSRILAIVNARIAELREDGWSEHDSIRMNPCRERAMSELADIRDAIAKEGL